MYVLIPIVRLLHWWLEMMGSVGNGGPTRIAASLLSPFPDHLILELGPNFIVFDFIE